MASIECKMCGGSIELPAGQTLGICARCGSLMTCPKTEDESRAEAFNRGNHFRRIGEFDQALSLYDGLVDQDEADAEAHWCRALCRFGIKYVQDPASHEWLPIVRRAGDDSFLEDADYLAAVTHSAGATRLQYEKDAMKIAEVQRGIWAADAKLDRQIEPETEEPQRQLEGEAQRLEFEYQLACEAQETAKISSDYLNAKSLFSRLRMKGYKDSDAREAACLERADSLQKQDKTDKWFRIWFWILVPLSLLVLPYIKDTYTIPSQHYRDAEAYLRAENYDGAIHAFSEAGEFKDARKRILEAYYAKGEALLEHHDYDGAIEAFTSAGNYSNAPERLVEAYYAKAEVLLEAQDYEGAIVQLRAAGSFRDAKELLQELQMRFYDEAKAFEDAGDLRRAAIAYGHAGSYADSIQRSRALWAQQAEWNTISACFTHTVGLKSDGTVVAVGSDANGQCSVTGWTDIVAISAGEASTIGLKADGTIVAAGAFRYYQNDLSNWTNIVAVAVDNGISTAHLLGLRSDGTVAAVGANFDGACDVADWRDIVAVAAGDYHSVGLKFDGTVVATSSDYDGESDVSGWTDIVAVSAGSAYTAGLKSDGTVVAVGNNDDGQCDVSGWTDIVAISAGNAHTIGLKSDGTVVAVGDNKFGQCDVSGWTDIVAVAAGFSHTIGLKSDGTVVAVGANYMGNCDVSGWTDIKLPGTIEASAPED